MVYFSETARVSTSYILVPDEQRLYETLMDGYEKSVRPVRNSTTILRVKFALHLNQIIGLVSTSELIGFMFKWILHVQ